MFKAQGTSLARSTAKCRGTLAGAAALRVSFGRTLAALQPLWMLLSVGGNLFSVNQRRVFVARVLGLVAWTLGDRGEQSAADWRAALPEDYRGCASRSDLWEDMERKAGGFEMFHCEYPLGQQPHRLQPFGSTCVWPDDAQQLRFRRPAPDDVWTQEQLSLLMRKNGIGLPKVLAAFGECGRGQIIRRASTEAISDQYALPQNVLEITAGN